MGFNSWISNVGRNIENFGKGFVNTVDTISHQFDTTVANVNQAAVNADKEKSIAAPFISGASDILNILDVAQKAVIQPVFDQAKVAIAQREAITPSQSAAAGRADITQPSTQRGSSVLTSAVSPVTSASSTPSAASSSPVDTDGNPTTIGGSAQPVSRFLRS